jgi:hypothetical protein
MTQRCNEVKRKAEEKSGREKRKRKAEEKSGREKI